MIKLVKVENMEHQCEEVRKNRHILMTTENNTAEEISGAEEGYVGLCVLISATVSLS